MRFVKHLRLYMEAQAPYGRKKKKGLENFYTVTATQLSASENESQNHASTTSASASIEEASDGTQSQSRQRTPKHFYRHDREKDAIVYYNDTRLVGSMTKALTVLADGLDNNIKQHSNAANERWGFPRLEDDDNNDVALTEPSHQRREMARQENDAEIDKNYVMAQLNLAHSLKIRKQAKDAVDKRIQFALMNNKLSANVHSFVILHSKDDSVEACINYLATIPYECVSNHHRGTKVCLDQLFADMTPFEKAYKEVLIICNYLNDRVSPLNYIIYKKEIEYIGDKPVSDVSITLCEWLFESRRTGFYYAVIVNFGLSKPTETLPSTILLKHSFIQDVDNNHSTG
jgi:hypothetical protein